MDRSVAGRVAAVVEAMRFNVPAYVGMASAAEKIIDDLDRLMRQPGAPEADEWLTEWKAALPAIEQYQHELAIVHATMNRFLKRLKKL